MDVLSWEVKEFMESQPERKCTGIIFKINDEPVDAYKGLFQPVYFGDIEYSHFFDNSLNNEEEYDPVLACCTCGQADCDSIRAFVTLSKEVIQWDIYNANGSFTREENLNDRYFGTYIFDINQYKITIKNLLDTVKIKKGGH